MYNKDDFEKALPNHKTTGEPLWTHWRLDREHVYHVSIDMPETRRIIVRSGLDADGKVMDDIRCWVEYHVDDHGWHSMGSGRTIKRTKGWQGRLEDALRKAYLKGLNNGRSNAQMAVEGPRVENAVIQQEEAGKAAAEFTQAIDEQLAKPLGLVKVSNSWVEGPRVDIRYIDEEKISSETVKALVGQAKEIERKDKAGQREILEERVGFASDPDLGSDELVAEAKTALRKFDHKARRQVRCPECGRKMVKRSGKYGEFYGCTGFPKHCSETLQLEEAQKQLDADPSVDEDKVYHSSHHVTATTPEEFKPSPFQEKIFDFIETGAGNGMVEAVAGSGKTTTIVKALELTEGKVLFCAFNKHIQQELARRAPRHVEVGTVHSIGRRALVKALPHKPELDDSKLWGITKELLPEDDQYPLRQPLAKLVSMCKKTLTDYTDPIAIETIADYYGVELNGDGPAIIELVPRAMALCAERLAVIDFDDMIWLPTQLNLSMPRYDWVFVDEAQDLSKAQAAIVQASLADKGRIVLVGDRRQSIYGFTGADCDSIPRLIELFDCETLPLSITYRCPKSVVELAQRIVPQIQAAEWAEDGVVKDASEYNWQQNVKDKDLILCRVNAPLVKACYSFIRRGRKAVIRGRDIGKGLINFIDKLKPVDVADLLVKIRDYKARETARLEAAGKEERIEAIQDRCETLVAVCEGIVDLTELRSRIDHIFNDKTKNGIILSSIHRAKGDEADTVYILHPELLPHPLAQKPWQQIQEANLEYVAYTRSKATLVMVR